MERGGGRHICGERNSAGTREDLCHHRSVGGFSENLHVSVCENTTDTVSREVVRKSVVTVLLVRLFEKVYDLMLTRP